MKLKYTIVQVLLLIIFTASAEDCNNPLLKASFNPGRAPTNGAALFGLDPTLGENLPICQRLEGKQQCCDKAAWESLKTVYTTLKKQFTDSRKKKASAFNNQFKKAKDNYGKSDITQKKAKLQQLKKGDEQIKLQKMCKKNFPTDADKAKKAAETKKPATQDAEVAPTARFLEKKDVVKLYRLLQDAKKDQATKDSTTKKPTEQPAKTDLVEKAKEKWVAKKPVELPTQLKDQLAKRPKVTEGQKAVMGKDGKWNVVDLKAKIEAKAPEKGSFNSKDKSGAQKGGLMQKKNREWDLWSFRFQRQIVTI